MVLEKQSGNVLFLILIAVALFAALAYAVSSSTRNSSGSPSKETAKANAASIIQLSTSLRNSILRMKISNDCTDSTLDFGNPVYMTNAGTLYNTANNNAPANCRLFDPGGGGMSAVIIGPAAFTKNDPSSSTAGGSKLGHLAIRIGQFKGVGTDGAAGTASANDIFLGMLYLNRDTCLAINELLGVTNTNGEPPITTYSGSMGSYTNGALTGSYIVTSPETDGYSAFCHAQGASYQYLAVLVER